MVLLVLKAEKLAIWQTANVKIQLLEVARQKDIAVMEISQVQKHANQQVIAVVVIHAPIANVLRKQYAEMGRLLVQKRAILKRLRMAVIQDIVVQAIVNVFKHQHIAETEL